MTAPEKTVVSAVKKVGGGKVSLRSLGNIRKHIFDFDGPLSCEPTHYFCDLDGIRYDSLWQPRNNAKQLYVFFSGDANREKYTPPVFQRWKWAKRFPAACLFISDPTLACHEKLGLAWYCGTQTFDPMSTIARIIDSVARRMGISASQVVLYGSSGGGFAALRMLSQNSEYSAVSINPQVIISRYRKQADRYFSYAFPDLKREDVIETYRSRLNLLETGVDFLNRRILLCQNVSDAHHYEQHFRALTEHVGINLEDNILTGTFQTLLFDNPNGHAKAEAENPEVIESLINISSAWR